MPHLVHGRHAGQVSLEQLRDADATQDGDDDQGEVGGELKVKGLIWSLWPLLDTQRMTSTPESDGESRDPGKDQPGHTRSHQNVWDPKATVLDSVGQCPQGARHGLALGDSSASQHGFSPLPPLWQFIMWAFAMWAFTPGVSPMALLAAG